MSQWLQVAAIARIDGLRFNHESTETTIKQQVMQCNICKCDGIGIHVGLKIPCLFRIEGSTPFTCTIGKHIPALGQPPKRWRQFSNRKTEPCRWWTTVLLGSGRCSYIKIRTFHYLRNYVRTFLKWELWRSPLQKGWLPTSICICASNSVGRVTDF